MTLPYLHDRCVPRLDGDHERCLAICCRHVDVELWVERLDDDEVPLALNHGEVVQQPEPGRLVDVSEERRMVLQLTKEIKLLVLLEAVVDSLKAAGVRGGEDKSW